MTDRVKNFLAELAHNATALQAFQQDPNAAMLAAQLSPDEIAFVKSQPSPVGTGHVQDSNDVTH